MLYLRKAAQHCPDESSDITERRVTAGVSDVFAGDVQDCAQWYSTQCNVITHVEE